MTNATTNHGVSERSEHVRWRGNAGLSCFAGHWTTEPLGEGILVGLWRHPGNAVSTVASSIVKSQEKYHKPHHSSTAFLSEIYTCAGEGRRAEPFQGFVPLNREAREVWTVFGVIQNTVYITARSK